MAAHAHSSFEPSAGCVERAAFLSSIVHLDPAAAEKEVKEYQARLRFQFVHVTGQEYCGEHQVVCAKDCDGTLFICFRGASKGTTDILTKALVDQKELVRSPDDPDGTVGGRRFHEGAGFSLGVNQYRITRLRELCESEHPLYGGPKKLVFCGHSLGGALAHLALIKYIVGIPKLKNGEDKFGAVGIGFGAPHVCDPTTREYLATAYKIDDRIFNYVTAGDPVPRILNNLPQSVCCSAESLPQDVNKSLLVQLVSDQNLRLNSCVDNVTRSLKWLVIDHAIDFGLHCLGLASESLVVEAAKCITALVAAGLEVKATSTSRSDYVWYVPLGQWRRAENLEECVKMSEAKEELQGAITEEHLRWHTIAVYLNNIFQQRPNIDSQTESANHTAAAAPAVVVVERPRLTITRASRKLDAGASEIVIDVEGENLELMCLQARVWVGTTVTPGDTQARVGDVRDHVTLHDEVKRYSNARDRTCEMVLRSKFLNQAEKNLMLHKSVEVEIVTCFGNAKWELRDSFQPVHKEWPHSFVAQAYFACLCKLALWKHAACHNGDRSSSSSWPLQQDSACSTEFSHADSYPFQFLSRQLIGLEPLANIIKHKLRPRVSTMLEELLRIRDITIEEEESRFKECFLKTVGGGAIGGAIGGCACTIGIAATESSLATFFFESLLAAGAAGVACGAGAVAGAVCAAAYLAQTPAKFEEKQVKVNLSYNNSLRLLLTVLWDVEDQTSNTRSDSEMEKETFRKSTSQKLQDLRNQIRTGTLGLLRTRVPERLNRSKGATFTAKTLLQFVDRAALIYDICSADEVLRRECKVVLVVGEENVGKSSLLKCILRSCGEDRLAETIKVGETTHTRNMEVYPCALKLSGRHDGELLLVDSPGTSTPDNRNEDSFAWQCMERVPDLCLVMLEFKGDVQRGSAELMEDIDGRKVCSTQNQVLVVNRVDSRLHGNPNAQVWRDLNLKKMEEMRSEFAKNSGIQKEKVLMTVLNEENLFAEELRLLRKRGVLLQKEATDAILSILRDLFTE